MCKNVRRCLGKDTERNTEHSDTGNEQPVGPDRTKNSTTSSATLRQVLQRALNTGRVGVEILGHERNVRSRAPEERGITWKVFVP